MASTDPNPLVVLMGPSREQLFDALRLHHKKDIVGFRFQNLADYTLMFSVESLAVGDEIGDRWRVVLELKDGEAAELEFDFSRLEGIYDTRRREGIFARVH